MLIKVENIIHFFWFFLLNFNLSFSEVFKGCDYTYTLTENDALILRSPYWPDKYASRTSCRYKFIAPVFYVISYECDIELDQALNECSTELFYADNDGDTELRFAQQYCGTGHISFSSNFRILVLAYISDYNSTGSGIFECKITTKSVPCDCGWYKIGRIYGGKDTNINQYPSTVAILKDGYLLGSGTIVSSRFIITAAHVAVLITSPKEVTVWAGIDDILNPSSSRYALKIEIKEIYLHENYDSKNILNDIALLKTTDIIKYTMAIGPACLPLSRLNNNFYYEKVSIVGFGTIFYGGPIANKLQSANVQVITKEECEKTYENVSEEQICTYWYATDSCQLDSGGGVYAQENRNFLIGIISYGKGCSGVPSINTRITSYMSWICNHLEFDVCYYPMLQ